MTAAKVVFARSAYRSGKCPGCGAPLVDVAGIGIRHLKGGFRVSVGSKSKLKDRAIIRGENGPVVISQAGDPTGGAMDPKDHRVCPWTADDLAALVHIGSGLVSA